MDPAPLLLQVVGQSHADRIVIGVTWVGLVALAAIILLAAARNPRSWIR